MSSIQYSPICSYAVLDTTVPVLGLPLTPNLQLKQTISTCFERDADLFLPPQTGPFSL